MAFAAIALSTSIVASIAGLAGFTFLLWIFWLAAYVPFHPVPA